METTANYTEADFKARSFGKMIDKALEDNVVDASEASVILDSYNKNRGEILMYTRDQLSNLQDALWISHRNKLFANREMIALKRVLLSNETGIKPETKAEDGPITDIKPSKLAWDIVWDSIEVDKEKKYARLWSTDSTITLKLVSNPSKRITFRNDDNAVVEFTWETVLWKRKWVMVGGELYWVYPTSFIETNESLTDITPEMFAVIAERYLGRAYDSYKWIDGWVRATADGKYQVAYGKNWPVETVDEKPLACSDLIREVLLAAGLKFDFFDKDKQDNYDFRRVEVMEKELFTQPGFKMDRIDKKNMDCKVWDFLTTTKKWGGTRHIWIVKEIWDDGKPTKIIHSSFSARQVVETDLATFTKNGKYELTNRVRFMPETYRAAAEKQWITLAMNYV